MRKKTRNGWLQQSEIVRSENGCTTNKRLQQGSLPGGNYNGGSFNNLGSNGNWWSSTENSSNAWNRNMNYNNGEVNRNNNNQSNGFSVRCVRDLLNACYQPAGCWAGFLNF